MIDFAASVSVLLSAFLSWYVWLVLNYVQVFPLALLSLVCGVANYSVNGKLWKIDSIEHELNPIHRWFMGRFGVDRGMALSIIIAGSIFISGIAIPLLMFHPQYFLQGFVILSVPPLAIVSPVAVVMLVNDYYWLHRLGRDVVTFKVMGLEGKGKVNTVTH